MTRTLRSLVPLLLLLLCGCDRQPQDIVADARQRMERGDYRGAILQLKNRLVESPQDGEARLLLGHALQVTGEPVPAERELRKALELGVERERVLPTLARSLLIQCVRAETPGRTRGSIRRRDSRRSDRR